MAKKNVASAEDRLAAALVPAEEQLYQVPENWCWCHLSEVLFASKDKTEDFSDSSVKYVGLEHMEKGQGIISYGSSKGIRSLKNVFVPGQILYGKLRPYLNKHDVAAFPGICSTDILVFNIFPTVIVEFVNHYLDQDYFIKHAVENSKGINLPRVSESDVLSAVFPLPPLSEQRRIVDRITSLFAQLDEAKEEAQAVIDGYEDRKAVILNDGVQGLLTETWQKEHGYSKDDWRTTKLSDVCILQTGLMKGKHFQKKTVLMPYLRVANVQDGFLDLNEIKEIEVESENYQRYLLKDGDVLFTEGGDYDKLGRGTVWHCEVPKCLHQNHIFVVRPAKETLLPEFLSYQAGSLYGKRYFLSCSKQTTNLASINSSQLKNFPLILPPIVEQQEIVQRIDKAIAQEAAVKSAAEDTIAQIDALRQSILARAFRGELGTNDPTDEPAIELLKRTSKG